MCLCLLLHLLFLFPLLILPSSTSTSLEKQIKLGEKLIGAYKTGIREGIVLIKTLYAFIELLKHTHKKVLQQGKVQDLYGITAESYVHMYACMHYIIFFENFICIAREF